MQMIARNITAPYSAGEAWFYDSFVAPAVVPWFVSEMSERIDAIAPGSRVLDVGCGGGQNLMAIAQRRSDLELVGVDLSAAQVRRAWARARRHGLKARFLEASALDLPFEEGEFDVVISIASIKHWPDQARGIGECARVLRSGGLLIVSEADRGCRLEHARSFVGMMHVPWPLEPLAVAGFRTLVAGQGLDLDDARRLAAGLPLADLAVTRIPGAPALMIEGRKA